MKISGVFQSHYLPCIEYVKKVSECDVICVDSIENYEKQSYRNRCYIKAANGILVLVIPILKPKESKAMKDIKISYHEDWVRVHWNSITSAYRSSPYFYYIENELKEIIYQKNEFLFDLNMAIFSLIIKTLRLDITLSNQYELTPTNDFRNHFDCKAVSESEFIQYHQLFSDRKETFMPNLSVLDFICNDLMAARSYFQPKNKAYTS